MPSPLVSRIKLSQRRPPRACRGRCRSSGATFFELVEKGDHIISLEDGKPYKSLKRHLTGRGLTPAQYRQKWGLRPDYPMVAPEYSKRRSELALSLGLGRKAAKEAVEATPEPKAQKRKSTPKSAPKAAPKGSVKRSKRKS